MYQFAAANLFEKRFVFNGEKKEAPVVVTVSVDRSKSYLNNAEGRKKVYSDAAKNAVDGASDKSPAVKSKAKEVKDLVAKARALEGSDASDAAKKAEAVNVESANTDLLTIMLEGPKEAPKKSTSAADLAALEAAGAETNRALRTPPSGAATANVLRTTPDTSAALEAAAKNAAKQPDTTGRLNLGSSGGPVAFGENRLQDVVPPGVVVPAAPAKAPTRVASTPPAKKAPEKKA